MPKIAYETKRFGEDTLRVIAQANDICDQYTADGYTLTLRQLYYQFVARALIPNNMQSYKRLGSIVNDARLAGLMDWEAIEDRTRNLEKLASWGSPSDILAACAQQFRYDWWSEQPVRVEVWVEKEALAGVIERIANTLRVPYFACRGYTSQSEAWRAGRRFAAYNEQGQSVKVLHLGDHDPSGIDMTRDNNARLQLFSEQGDVEVIRLALNIQQVNRYNPPPNPAKLTDSRAEGYIERFGPESWELDALDPKIISDLIRDETMKYVDEDAWKLMQEREAAARARIKALSDGWTDDDNEEDE